VAVPYYVAGDSHDRLELPERLCAYIDVLGFRGYVASLSEDSTKVACLKNTLETVHRPLQAGLANRTALEYRTQSISDAVAISVIPTVEGMVELFITLEFLVMALLASGYFVRGAITKGRLYHDDTTVFGDALVRAYDLERTVVRYPRIMITSEAAAIANETDKLSKVCRGHMRVDEDGPRYLHVLHRMQSELEAEKGGVDKDTTDKFGKYYFVRQQICLRYNVATDNPRHFEKVKWFARYWNRTIPVGASSLLIQGAVSRLTKSTKTEPLPRPLTPQSS
jgi:hypothetical protein